MTPGNKNSYNSLKKIRVNEKEYNYYSLNEAEKIMHRLPIIIRPILESLKNEMLMRIKII